jgi:hypothetical protein
VIGDKEMESSDRGGLLSAGGILSIIVGVFELIVGIMLAITMASGMVFWTALPWGGLDFRHGFAFGGFAPTTTIVIIIGIVLLVLGILALIGGISAIKRRSFGMSVLGAICALLPINVLGLLAVVFVSLAKGEFNKDD